MAGGFASRVVDWQRTHGRHHLPWQAPVQGAGGPRLDPYRVWLSEVMLQQTQVRTVLGYYGRFLARFPDLASLARAGDDEVMALWAGLGYYSRARNLLACARMLVEQHGGRFPQSAAALAELPGIGRSTAAAIAAFCFGERAAILDANVRRLLLRWSGDDGQGPGAPGSARLWALAESLLPQARSDMAAYTQGLMDLGAAVCTPRSPQCDRCPLRTDCRARASGTPELHGQRRRQRERLQLSHWMLWAQRPDGAIWLQRRGRGGIWAGLHALPMFDSPAALRAMLPPDSQPCVLPMLRHDLTHRRLLLHPVRVRWLVQQPPAAPGAWVLPQELAAVGLPAPLARLLRSAPG